MNNRERIAYKKKLKRYCEEMIQQRIDAAKKAIENAREVTNQEEKSTVGDKYETARAMGQLEQDMYARQLAENLKEFSTLQSIDTDNICKEASAGAFVQCQNMSFFIAAGLGKKKVDEMLVLFLSPNAPLAKILLHKKIGEAFVFNTVKSTIEDLF